MLQTCHLLNYNSASRKQLTHCLRRASWLTEGQSRTFSDELPAQLEHADQDLIFVHLSDPEPLIPVNFRELLSRHASIIVTSPYPVQLFRKLPFVPFDFLTEPLTFDRFETSLEKYVAIHG
ncbi:hypothetical protein [Fibrella forsythiae]|uniref:Uncharacterized protein n=1 Tax=Fibrella forsythiae TaxID=2817061 RepID=A0ABS3JFR1_9BACT|nr:hypothetical protein [Fibrella forsythiae]MBO0948815.1 hypothetical protein [Fibrella forsythiae]